MADDQACAQHPEFIQGFKQGLEEGQRRKEGMIWWEAKAERAEFAKAALTGLLAADVMVPDEAGAESFVVVEAFRLADAMLAESQRRPLPVEGK